MPSNPLFPVRPQIYINLLIAAGIALLFLWTRQFNTLLFHSVAELMSIVFAFAAFVFGWNARRFTDNDFLPFVGAGMLVVAGLDAAHLIVTIRADLLPVQIAAQGEALGFSARLIQGLVWLLAPFFIVANSRRRSGRVIAIFLLVAGLYVTIITRADIFTPRLLPFFSPIASNLAFNGLVLVTFLLAGAHLSYRRRDLDRRFYWAALSSILLGVMVQFISIIGASTLNFRFEVYAKFLLGASLFMAFAAVFEIGYRKPFEFIFQGLKEQKDLLQDVFDIDPSGMAILSGPRVQFRAANPAYRALLPYPEIDPVGCTYSEIWSPTEGHVPREDILGRVMASRKPIFTERNRLVYPDGTLRYLNIHLQPTIWRGEPAVLIVLWEITNLERGQQQAEATAQEANQWAAEMQTLMDAVPAVVLVTTDPQTGRVYGNRFAYDRLHLPDETNLNYLHGWEGGERPYRLIKDGRELAPGELPIQAVARSGRPVLNYTVDMLLPDGELSHLFGNIHPLLTAEGQPRGAVGTFIDVTQLVQTENALRDSEARFRGLIESMNDLVYTIDHDLRYTGIYGKGLERFGWSAEDFIGKTITDVLGEEAAAEHLPQMRRALLGENVVYEWILRWNDQTVPYQTSLSPIINDEGEISGIVGVGHDISHLKQAEVELERSNSELEQFAYVASHDLKEPLRKVRFFTERLVENKHDQLDEQDIDYINRMQGATRRMQAMIDDLLAYSRVATKAQPFVPVDLNVVVGEVLCDLEARLERSGGKVETDELPTVDADPLQMRQLLQNLIGNGLKYHRPDVPPLVRISAKPARKLGSVQIIIEDNGIGIDAQHHERIFQPFERLHGRSEYEGTGMGLAICRKIVERHAGRIRVDSQAGKGSTFTVTLPKHQARTSP